MRKLLLALCLVTVSYRSVYAEDISAAELITDIYKTCISQYSTNCVKPKALAWISEAVNHDQIRISDDLTIIRTSEEIGEGARSANPIINLFDRLDSFLSTHSLKIEAPQQLKTEEARSFIPESLLNGGLAQGLQVPLVEGNAVEGRGFVKKVMIPFLLGLKFKSTVLVPLALALIAMKTWKAMTLGLLSLVMTAAMMIFKFAKPVHYEVVHYEHPHIHAHPHIDHVHAPPPHAPIVFEPQPGWARQLDAQETAYNAYL